MSKDSVDYKILRKIQQEEKSSPFLTKIDYHLFEDAEAYHSVLVDRLQKDVKPSRQLIISEQIQNVEKIIKSIYEIREKKIILAAMAKARGGNPNEKHFISLEKTLFLTVHSLLLKNREHLLYQKVQKNKDAYKNERELETEPQTNLHETLILDKNEEVTIIVRILETIPTFIGTDTREYHLKKHDIVSLPKNLASMLISKKVAEPLMMKK